MRHLQIKTLHLHQGIGCLACTLLRPAVSSHGRLVAQGEVCILLRNFIRLRLPNKEEAGVGGDWARASS